MEASDFLVGNYFGGGGGQFLPDNRYLDQKPADHNHFTIDDLLDFPKEDEVMTDAFLDSIAGNSADSSTLTAVDSCNSSVSVGEPQFSSNISCRSFNDAQFSSSEFCVPYDDLAEREWLSNFVEESFSSDDMQNSQFIPTATCHKSPTNTSSTATNKNSSIFNADVAVPAKARSKRSRASPCNWPSRLLLLSSDNSSSENNVPNPMSSKKRENSVETPGRRCLHCASEKTPQWRTGPLGPKTLCNACGVRYKSGRLVPEYSPAASPTFVLARHSNSHKKVMELRRQKDLRVGQQQQLLSQTSFWCIQR